MIWFPNLEDVLTLEENWQVQLVPWLPYNLNFPGLIWDDDGDVRRNNNSRAQLTLPKGTQLRVYNLDTKGFAQGQEAYVTLCLVPLRKRDPKSRFTISFGEAQNMPLSAKKFTSV